MHCGSLPFVTQIRGHIQYVLAGTLPSPPRGTVLCTATCLHFYRMDLKLHGARRSAVDLHTHTEQRLTVGLVQVMGPKKVRIPPMSNSPAPPKSQLVSTSGRLSHKLSPPPLPLPPSFRVPALSPHALVVIKVAAATAAAARRRDAMCLWVWGDTWYRLARECRRCYFLSS